MEAGDQGIGRCLYVSPRKYQDAVWLEQRSGHFEATHDVFPRSVLKLDLLWVLVETFSDEAVRLLE